MVATFLSLQSTERSCGLVTKTSLHVILKLNSDTLLKQIYVNIIKVTFSYHAIKKAHNVGSISCAIRFLFNNITLINTKEILPDVQLANCYKHGWCKPYCVSIRINHNICFVLVSSSRKCRLCAEV